MASPPDQGFPMCGIQFQIQSLPSSRYVVVYNGVRWLLFECHDDDDDAGAPTRRRSGYVPAMQLVLLQPAD